MQFLCGKHLDIPNNSASLTQAHGSGSSSLSTLIAFYCTTIIGALERTGKVSELQITHLLEALVRGYASKNKDFVAANYMITAQLVSKASLSTTVLNRLVSRIVTKVTQLRA